MSCVDLVLNYYDMLLLRHQLRYLPLVTGHNCMQLQLNLDKLNKLLILQTESYNSVNYSAVFADGGYDISM